MGVWGAGSFENDSALDWVGQISKVGDIVDKFDALAQLDDESDAIIDAGLASEIVAAAEVTAILMGQTAPNIPQDVLQNLSGFGKADAALIEQAKMAVSEVLGDSKLLDLWSESSDSAEWNLAITGLIERLNADVTNNPPSTAEIEEISGGLSPCIFCNKDIEPKELTSLSIRDMTSKDSLFMERGQFCHLSCLNSKLHPKHLIQNWKFSVDDALVDQLLGDTPD